MFGFQRIGDMAWAAGDMQARGFMVGATSGRTTLNGEGLQHQDGHSHIQAGTIPNCVSYDPTYGYELAVIVQNGIERMYGETQENIYYYLTTLNENYQQPAMPEGVSEGIIKGIYKFDSVGASDISVKLLGCGSIFEQVRQAATILADDFGVKADLYSVTSFNELGRDGQDVERYNMLNPEKAARVPYITQVLGQDEDNIVIASTDHMKAFAEQVRAYIPGSYKVLGTDGFGRSDSRANLRSHFEVDAAHVVDATLSELVKRGKVEQSVFLGAMERFGISGDKINPLYA